MKAPYGNLNRSALYPEHHRKQYGEWRKFDFWNRWFYFVRNSDSDSLSEEIEPYPERHPELPEEVALAVPT